MKPLSLLAPFCVRIVSLSNAWKSAYKYLSLLESRKQPGKDIMGISLSRGLSFGEVLRFCKLIWWSKV